MTYPSNTKRVIIHTGHNNGNEKNVYNKVYQTNINLKMFVFRDVTKHSLVDR